MATLKNTVISDTGFLKLPLGTTIQKPGTVVQSFVTPGTTSWTAPTGVTSVTVLVVAGGGGGGRWGGGGGAGGVVYNSSYTVVPGTSYTVTVGLGGFGHQGDNQSASIAASNGRNSVFDTITAIGGGGGGCYTNTGTSGSGAAGGSGGGGAQKGPGASAVGAAGAAQQGNSGGGTGYGNAGGVSSAVYQTVGGGGGGAGSAGSAGTAPSNAGYGGAGIAFSISGVSRYYAGGGAGVRAGSFSGGIGGGGNGIAGGVAISPMVDGAYGTGSGGAGTEDSLVNAFYRAGNGGGGCVILSYAQPSGVTSASSGMMRFNSSINTLETYRPINDSRYQIPMWTSDHLDQTGLVVSYDLGDSRCYNNARSFLYVRAFTVTLAARAANYTVEYSDDNSTWTAAWTGTMTSVSTSGGVIQGSGGGGSYGAHRYWRYRVTGTVTGHHPRVSRIFLVDATGYEIDVVRFVEDNMVDNGSIPDVSSTYGTGPTHTLDFATVMGDLSGFNHHSTLVGNCQYVGDRGGGIHFDGSGNQYTRVNSTRHLAMDHQLTMMVIFKIDTNNGGGLGYSGLSAGQARQCLIGKHYLEYELGIYPGDYGMGGGIHTYLARGVNNYGAYTEGISCGAPWGAWKPEQWYCITTTLSGMVERGYFNGVASWGSGVSGNGSSTYHLKGEAGTASTGTSDGAGNHLYLGCRFPAGGLYLKGTIGVTKIWNRALTPDEVFANYAIYKQRYGI